MSQVPVKWVEPNFLLTDIDKLRYSSKRRQRDMIPVVPLSALREVVERLQKLVNEARGFEAMANDQSHGYTNRRILRERIDEAQRLLAHLDAEGVQ